MSDKKPSEPDVEQDAEQKPHDVDQNVQEEAGKERAESEGYE